jgi:tRNA pseudouridine55 synthase
MDVKQLSGFLLVDKPAGITSFDVIRQLRRQTGIRTFGHAGTLDPFATGLMLMAVNKYTRLLPLLDDADKEYQATLLLGKFSTTGDPEGIITEEPDAAIQIEKMATLAKDVLRIEKLKPPIHSAIKVDGKRAYARARADEDFELPERDSRVYSFMVLSYVWPELAYHCKVSKGTYIRSLSQWIAQYLGTTGYTAVLRRTAIGKVTLDKADQLADITTETISAKLLSVLDIIPDVASITLTDEEFLRIRNGNSIACSGDNDETVVVLDQSSECRGIALRRENRLYPKVNL